MRDRQCVRSLPSWHEVMWLGLLGAALWFATTSAADANADVSEEIECLALNIYFEARGEPSDGKLAVGHVVMNRVMDRRYPERICAVVRQGGEVRRHRCQFSWWCDGRSDDPKEAKSWEESMAIARRIFWGHSEDITGGALWYHAKYVRPYWRKRLVRGPVIGRHIFYHDGKGQEVASRPAIAMAGPDGADLPPAKASIWNETLHAQKSGNARQAATERAETPAFTRERYGASLWLLVLKTIKAWMPNPDPAIVKTSGDDRLKARMATAGKDAT